MNLTLCPLPKEKFCESNLLTKKQSFHSTKIRPQNSQKMFRAPSKRIPANQVQNFRILGRNVRNSDLEKHFQYGSQNVICTIFGNKKPTILKNFHKNLWDIFQNFSKITSLFPQIFYKISSKSDNKYCCKIFGNN